MYRIWWNRFLLIMTGRLKRRFGGQNADVLFIMLMCFVTAGLVMIQERLVEVDRTIVVIRENSGEADTRAFLMPKFMYEDADMLDKVIIAASEDAEEQTDKSEPDGISEASAKITCAAGPAAAAMLALMCGCGENFSAGEYIYMADKLSEDAVYGRLYEKLELLLDDIRCFPVNDNVPGGSLTAYEDSWFAARTYGGNRKHEGTDIMSVENVSGVLEIISVSDGIVENKGWLPQGGYRIGIRSGNGVYYYYAHLHSYAEGLEIGSRVSAGDIIGYMGDTGYSDKEGTTGMFDVHLHFGIYFKEGTREVSINPYYLLRYIGALQTEIQ